MKSRRWSSLALATALAIGAWTSPAEAALTDSEKAQIRDFYTRGDAVNAPRVRALLARPDLSPDEIRDAFIESAKRAPFDEKHEKFVRDLLFGPASQASRSELLAPVIEGLLARASAVVAAPGAEAKRAEELVRIHGFVTSDVARATRTGRGQGAAAVRSDALKSVVTAYREHLGAPALDPKKLSATMRPARVQAELALVQLARDVHARPDVASWVTHSPAAQSVYARTGVLVHGLSIGPIDKANAVAQMMDEFPQATRDLSVLWIDKPWPRQLIAPGDMVVAQARLGDTSTIPAEARWSSSVQPAPADAAMVEVAYVLARAGAASLLASDPTFREATGLAIQRARRGGAGGFLAVGATEAPISLGDSASISEQTLLTHTAELLLLDAPRALALAVAHATENRHQPMEQFALALGLLAADADGKLRASVDLGAPWKQGTRKAAPATAITGTPGRVDAFELGGHAIQLTREADGTITKVEVDGASPDVTKLSLARPPTLPGPAWSVPASKSSSQLRFELLAGPAEMGFPTSSSLRLRAAGSARAMVHTPSPGPTYRVSGRVLEAAAGSALVLRANLGSRGISGAAIAFRGAGKSATAKFVVVDESGEVHSLAPEVPLPADATGHTFDMKLGRTEITIELGGKKVTSALPAGLVLPKNFDKDPKGIALVAGKGGDLVVEGLSVQVPPAK